GAFCAPVRRILCRPAFRLVPELKAEVHAVSEERRVVDLHDGGRTAETGGKRNDPGRGGRNLRQVHLAIDLVARAGHTADEEEIVANKAADAIAKHEADLWLDFCDDAEFRLLECPAIAGRGKEAARQRALRKDLAVRLGQGSVADNGDLLLSSADAELAVGVEVKALIEVLDA